MQFISINENDIVEMKKPHPCEKRCKQFKIVRVGADVKIQCLACGAVIMMDRYSFNQKIKKVIQKAEND
ncbi:MAG: DUF951 domain-containing protein [Coprobacillus sp.]|nr:DUF951 domain-containing protein [Coprobacillus sp.]